MSTADAREYVSRREIPQLFEVSGPGEGGLLGWVGVQGEAGPVWNASAAAGSASEHGQSASPLLLAPMHLSLVGSMITVWTDLEAPSLTA